MERKAENIKRKRSDLSFQMDCLSLALFPTTGTHFFPLSQENVSFGNNLTQIITVLE